MSKAFTNEQNPPDDDADLDSSVVQVPGGKNYITPAGLERLRAEFVHLLDKVRPEVTKTVTWAASLGDRSENADYIYGKKRLREIDRRIRFLTKRIEAAEVVDPISVKDDCVRFGATVTVRDENEHLKSFSIVGIDETDIKRGRISWISPLGSVLLKGKVGETVTFRSPKGEEDLEIIEIKYVMID